MTPRHLELLFGLHPRQEPRRSGYVAQLRFDVGPELHDARFQFEGGAARPGEMVYALVWFRDREAATAIARTRMRFDVLERGQVVASGEVLAR